MATISKSSNAFEDAIRQYLDQRAESDNMFAIRYASPSKSVTECCQFIINEVKRQGVNVMTNDEVFGLAVHYFDGDCTEEEIGKPINCKVVVSKDQLTDEDKAELREQAMKEYKEEQLRAIRRENQPSSTKSLCSAKNPQAKATTSAPKQGSEINVEPNLFGEDF